MWQSKRVRRVPWKLFNRVLQRHAGESEWYVAEFEWEREFVGMDYKLYSMIRVHWEKRNPFVLITDHFDMTSRTVRIYDKMPLLDRLRLWWLMRGCQEV